MEFAFEGNYSEQDKELFVYAQNEDLQKICDYLETPLVNVTNRIKFKVFGSREGKQNADPNHSVSRASARFNEMTVYRFWLPKEDAHFPHEITHLVAHTWGTPYIMKTELDTWDNQKIVREIEMVSTSFMQEGLAIAVDDIVFKRGLLENGVLKLIDEWCREQIDKNPSLMQTINIDGFSRFENEVVIPFAASFSKYLLSNFGVSKYKKMYSSIKESLAPSDNIAIIEKLYQTPEVELIKAWKKFIC